MGERVFLLAFRELTLYVKGTHHCSCLPRESQESNRGGQAWQQGATVKPAWPSALKPILGVTFAHLYALMVFPFGPEDGGQGLAQAEHTP